MNLDIFYSLFSNIWSVFLVILCFGGSIFIHELGHFWAARKRGLKIERFSIGFGPKLFGWTKDGVEYRISLLPLGGYVALPQLGEVGAIEGGQKSDISKLPPISFSDKVIVAGMGAIFNIGLAFFLSTVLWVIGQPSSSEQQTTTIGYVAEKIHLDDEKEVPGPAYKAGLLPGDVILKVDDVEVKNFKDMQQLVLTGSLRDEKDKPRTVFTIDRSGKRMKIEITPQLVQINPVSDDKMRFVGIIPKQELIIGKVFEHSPAEEAGIQGGDIILSANGTRLYSLASLHDIINQNPKKGVDLRVDRDGKILSLMLLPQLVPYTKPIAVLSARDKEGHEGSIKIVTSGLEGASTGTLINPSSEGSLKILEITDGGHLFKDVKAGQVITAVNDEAVRSLSQLMDVIRRQKGDAIVVKVEGDKGFVKMESVDAKIVDPREQALIGIQLRTVPVIIHVNPLTQFSENVKMTFTTLWSLLNSKSDIKVKNLMGPPGMMRVLHSFSTQDLRLLIWFVVLLNINLAILNLLPVPVLDGGHILFATIGKLRGKSLPANLIGATQGVFMIFLFSLMLYVSFFDIRRWQGDNRSERAANMHKEFFIPTTFEFKKDK